MDCFKRERLNHTVFCDDALVKKKGFMDLDWNSIVTFNEGKMVFFMGGKTVNFST